MDKKLWGEVLTTAKYLQNILPSSAVSKTPFELWYGIKPNYGHLKVFGCNAWIQTPKANVQNWKMWQET